MPQSPLSSLDVIPSFSFAELAPGTDAPVARVWRGWTTPENADAYERLLRETVLPGIRQRLDGSYHGAWLLRRATGEDVEFVTTLLFDDLDAVRRFAGEDHEQAVVPDAARRLLSRFDERSAHYALRLALL